MRITIAMIAAAALALAGCAHDNELARAQAEATARASELGIERAKADAEEAKAVQRLADKIDAGGATAYLVTKSLGRGAALAAPPQVIVQQPQSLIGVAWQAALQVADIALRGFQIKAGRDTAIAATNAQRDTAIASYGAFTSMGTSIATAGTAGYPYIQAPAANMTLSGTGVLGSGTYTGPVTTTTTTTRTCPGGTAAAGGNGAGTAGGGAGGGAPGGTC